MTVNLAEQRLLKTGKVRVVERIRKVLRKNPIYHNVQEQGGGASFTAEVKPRFWRFGVKMSIAVEEKEAGENWAWAKDTSVRVTVTSQQWWVLFDLFGYYRRYVREFFEPLRGLKQRYFQRDGEFERFYDEDGVLRQENKFDSAGEWGFRLATTYYKYDGSGRRMGAETYGKDGKLKSKTMS